MHKKDAEIRRLAGTMMSAPAIAEQLGVDRSTVYRVLGWRWSMPEPASILPAPPAEVYSLMTARTTDWNTIRHRIDVFCRAISDRPFAKAFRRDLLAIHRTRPARPVPAGLAGTEDLAVGPLGREQLMQMAGACEDDHAGLRDRALLLLLAVSGLRLNSLTGLDAEHICFTAATAELTVDVAALPARLIISCDPNPSLCAVQALRNWLQVSKTQVGPVFCRIDCWGNIEHRRVSTRRLYAIVSLRRLRSEAKSCRQRATAGAEPGPARRKAPSILPSVC